MRMLREKTTLLFGVALPKFVSPHDYIRGYNSTVEETYKDFNLGVLGHM